jgi:dolichol-phosphate mannosyltransferase
MMSFPPSSLLVMVPTYNEAENVNPLYTQIRRQLPDVDLLFVDDNSPDGTGSIIDALAQADKHVRVLHRPGKQGIGSAHLAGIDWAYENGYSCLVTMDADGTHLASDISRFIALAEHADIVVGSRFKGSDRLPGWKISRLIMTHLGHLLTRLLLRLPYDATGAFRLYRLDKIPRGLIAMTQSRGYAFFFESLHRLYCNRMAIQEVPISLPSRTYGHSKMRIKDIVQSVSILCKLGWITWTAGSKIVFVPPSLLMNDYVEGQSKTRQEWNAYWSGVGHPGKALYDLIAIIYRRLIIRPSLNSALTKWLPKGGRIMHAGCGSGMVDVDMCRAMNITALDISPAALIEYARYHPRHEHYLLGSIFAIPAEAGSFDGVFNLGVMEHFSEDEIVQILREFHRILKPGGRIVFFWPPTYGLATNALRFFHVVLGLLPIKKFALHPPEITHIRSKAETKAWLEVAGFRLDEFSFGPRDLFTYQVVVAERLPGTSSA